MYGIIDIGSNTIRLVIYAVTRSNENDRFQIHRIMNKKYTAALASYINAENQMSQEGIMRAVETLQELKQITDGLHLEHVYVFATAPFRNITNTQETVSAVCRESGYDITVLSGQQEAAFGFYGMQNELQQIHTNTIQSKGISFDLGGGSCELVAFDANTILSSCSLSMGSLNMYKKYVSGIVPTAAEVKKIQKHAQSTLKKISIPFHSELICCEGGSARAILKLIMVLYPHKVESSLYKSKRLNDLLTLYETEPKPFIKTVLKTAPDRIHTIVPGLIIMQCICETFHCQKLYTIQSGVREGYLLSMLERENHAKE